MKIIPQSKSEWVRLVVFPFKAYLFIAPAMCYFASFALRPPRHIPNEAAAIPLLLLYPCGLVLLVAAGLFGIWGPKGHASACIKFGIAELVFASILLPFLATA